jgi:CheY-like chemotaxis protein
MAERCRILYVDDVPEDQRLLAAAVELAGVPLDLTCVLTGAEALAQLQAGEVFDAILLDWNLPRTTGNEMLVDIRCASPRTPVLVVTGEPATVTFPRIVSLDAETIVAKPLDLAGWENFARNLCEVCEGFKAVSQQSAS